METLLSVLTSAGAGGVAVAVMFLAIHLVKAVRTTATATAVSTEKQSVQCQIDHASTRDLLERMVDSHESLVQILSKLETRLEILLDRNNADRYSPKGYV